MRPTVLIFLKASKVKIANFCWDIIISRIVLFIKSPGKGIPASKRITSKHPPRGGNSLAWMHEEYNYPRNYNISAKVCYFCLGSLQENQKCHPEWYLLTSLSGQNNQGGPSLSLQTYGRPGDCISQELFDNTLFFSIRRKYIVLYKLNVFPSY